LKDFPAFKILSHAITGKINFKNLCQAVRHTKHITAKFRRNKMKEVIKSYYLENCYGCVQLVKDGNGFLVERNVLSSVNNPAWSYSVHYFSTLEEAEASFDRQYSIDKSWERAI
jgi:hypothetical protein